MLPEFRLLDGGDLEGQVFEIHLSLFRVTVVTVEAVGVEKVVVLVRKRGGNGVEGGEEGGGEEERGEKLPQSGGVF